MICRHSSAKHSICQYSATLTTTLTATLTVTLTATLTATLTVSLTCRPPTPPPLLSFYAFGCVLFFAQQAVNASPETKSELPEYCTVFTHMVKSGGTTIKDQLIEATYHSSPPILGTAAVLLLLTAVVVALTHLHNLGRRPTRQTSIYVHV